MPLPPGFLPLAAARAATAGCRPLGRLAAASLGGVTADRRMTAALLHRRAAAGVLGTALHRLGAAVRTHQRLAARLVLAAASELGLAAIGRLLLRRTRPGEQQTERERNGAQQLRQHGCLQCRKVQDAKPYSGTRRALTAPDTLEDVQRWGSVAETIRVRWAAYQFRRTRKAVRPDRNSQGRTVVLYALHLGWRRRISRPATLLF